MTHWSRRRFAERVLRAATGLPAVSRLWSQVRSDRSDRKPQTRSFDLSLLDDWLTPNDLFFVREHLPAPALSVSKWKLSVRGTVNEPFDIDFDELGQTPRSELVAMFECAGNPVDGGLVSNARWTGTSLAALLDRAQPKAEAKFVRLWGADRDAPGRRRYYRSIPLAKAMQRHTLVAYEMNGKPLALHHGSPARAVVPGWYGMDSVKWLVAVEVLSREDTTPIMKELYVRQELAATGGSVSFSPVTGMQVKSVFSRPRDSAILLWKDFIVRGAAWAGEEAVATVEVSTDGGQSWHPARLHAGQAAEEVQPYTWVFWEYLWKIPRKGSYELVVRAIDRQGRAQPETRPVGRLDHNEMNHYQRVRCTVI